MKRMGIKNTVEYLYLALMVRWEKTAPPDNHEGLLDNKRERNTQKARMTFILRKIAAGQEKHVYALLSQFSRRNDGNSYVSNDSSWMIDPCSLNDDWFLEGCLSLSQKQLILQNLTKLDLSPYLVNCIDDFVAGKSIINRIPSAEEQEEILHRSIEMEIRRDAEYI
jgi:hypothetical protein